MYGHERARNVLPPGGGPGLDEYLPVADLGVRIFATPFGRDIRDVGDAGAGDEQQPGVLDHDHHLTWAGALIGCRHCQGHSLAGSPSVFSTLLTASGVACGASALAAAAASASLTARDASRSTAISSTVYFWPGAALLKY